MEFCRLLNSLSIHSFDYIGICTVYLFFFIFHLSNTVPALQTQNSKKLMKLRPSFFCICWLYCRRKKRNKRENGIKYAFVTMMKCVAMNVKPYYIYRISNNMTVRFIYSLYTQISYFSIKIYGEISSSILYSMHQQIETFSAYSTL